jgi:competence protein ComEA helix-hairpin-helix repeat region
MFKKLSVKIGFTETEIKVLLFLLALFLAGFSYIKFMKVGSEATYKEFDYSKEESLLLKSEQGDSLEEASMSTDKDSIRKQVLELKDKPYETTTKKEPAERSINLNSASREDLMKISGIGDKTAGNILSYREKNGKFKVMDELMNVKGIGEAKFAKFKKYLFIK